MVSLSPQMIASSPHHHPLSPRRRGSSAPGTPCLNRWAAAYWVARSSRAMTAECVLRACPPSPSLPRRDDLDLVAGLQRRLGPAAFRQHVVIHGDGEMGAFVFEFGEQGIDALRGDLPRLAVDDHTHRITSLSIAPRCTRLSVSS